MKEKPSYYAIIPAEVRYDDRLCANAKLMYGEITALSNKRGECWASNKYFATLYKTSTRTISRWIGELAKHGYIKYKGETTNRRLYLAMRFSSTSIDKNVHRTKDKSVHHNNIKGNRRPPPSLGGESAAPPPTDELKTETAARPAEQIHLGDPTSAGRFRDSDGTFNVFIEQMQQTTGNGNNKM